MPCIFSAYIHAKGSKYLEMINILKSLRKSSNFQYNWQHRIKPQTLEKKEKIIIIKKEILPCSKALSHQ